MLPAVDFLFTLPRTYEFLDVVDSRFSSGVLSLKLAFLPFSFPFLLGLRCDAVRLSHVLVSLLPPL